MAALNVCFVSVQRIDFVHYNICIQVTVVAPLFQSYKLKVYRHNFFRTDLNNKVLDR